MPHKLSFDNHKNKSMEWFFFNAPWYLQWLHDEDAAGRWKWYSLAARDHFRELYRRASHVTGLCPSCKQRPFARMGLRYNNNGSLSFAHFYCRECDPFTQYQLPSFFAVGRMHRNAQLTMIDAIKDKFIGAGRLTQAKMETFFRTDEHFVNATPGFFAAEHG